ncbi:DUF3540 domain-containing protein [bacterium SCSIO 12844]|nr:DUF3540 domain-containing protein [bacterium SCSIO 12844]
MNNTTSSIHLYQPHQQNQMIQAEVVDIENERYQIKIDDYCYYAKVAHSCLIAPQIGDYVNVTFTDSAIYILNILESAIPNTVTINLPSDTTISSQGKLQIKAKSIEQSALNIELVSQKVAITTSILKTLAEHIYQYSQYNQVKTNQLLKEVHEFEQSITQSLRMIVEQQMRIDAETIHLLSELDTTIDAQSVSLG